MSNYSLVAGIDPSLTNTAIVLLSPSGVVEKNLIQPKSLRGVARLRYIHEQVLDVLTSSLGVPELVVIEGYDYKGFSTIPLAECNAVIQLACSLAGSKIIHAAPAQVKKFATGCSQAEKHHMMTRYSLDNEHIADAMALGEIARGYLTGVSAKRCELEVIKALRDRGGEKKKVFKKIKTSCPVAV